VPLARRSGQSKLHLADLFLQAALRRGHLVAQVTVQKGGDVFLFDDLANVRSVRFGGDVFLFDRQAGAKLHPGLNPGEEEAGTEGATACENVEETNGGVAVR
jgi:hypothetical protein